MLSTSLLPLHCAAEPAATFPRAHFRNQSRVVGHMLTCPHTGPANPPERQAESVGTIGFGHDSDCACQFQSLMKQQPT